MSTMRINLNELRAVILEALKNAYDVLGLRPGASDDEVKSAWKKLALKNHPDRGGKHGDMVDINNAKDRLLNKDALFRFGDKIKGYEAPGGAPAPKAAEPKPWPKDVPNWDDRQRKAREEERAYWDEMQARLRREREARERQDAEDRERRRQGYYDDFARNQNPSPGPGAGRGFDDDAAPKAGYKWRASTYDVNWSRRIINQAPGHNKFWEVHVIDQEVTVTWGRIGSPGQKTTRHGSEGRMWARKQLRNKLNNGYVLDPNAGTRVGDETKGSPKQKDAKKEPHEHKGAPGEKEYKVYPYKGARRVVRVKGKLYGTGEGGKLNTGAQTKFQRDDRARVTPIDGKMKVGKIDGDHSQVWDPVDEGNIQSVVNELVFEHIARIAGAL